MNEVAVARPRVLTVIVSYNFEPWIERCLSSIRDSDYPSGVVIDNASTDRTVSIIAERYRWIRLVRSRKNLGFGQANNIGMRMALEEDYDYVFLVNQDAWIEANTVGTLVGLAEKYPDYGVLSPVHLDGKGNISTVRSPSMLGSIGGFIEKIGYRRSRLSLMRLSGLSRCRR